MATFVMLSKMSLASTGEVLSLAELNARLHEKLAEDFPEVKWIASYVLLGEYDFLHIFDAPGATVAAKVALLVNALGMGMTQTLTAIPFTEFGGAETKSA